ncbi:MAG: hypothetical protein KGL95_14740 [Patescibacteria group bacterium]|nr:hypothetical protein [Patescibacteria group bacterium]
MNQKRLNDLEKESSNLEELKHILQDHEKRISKLEESKSSSTTERKIVSDSDKALTDLLTDSFFTQPKTFGQVIKQLKTNATFSIKSNYKKTLEIFVQEKKLRRKISNHQWVYYKNE